MNGARGFRGAVAPDATRERELSKEFLQSLPVLALVRVNLGIGVLEGELTNIPSDSGRSVFFLAVSYETRQLSFAIWY
jgi:hypothetical protein